MLVKHHVMVSLSGGVIIYLLTQSLAKSIFFILPGIFIDIDHLFDYVRNYGWKIVGLRKFNHIFYTRKLKKIYVFLHSYELLLAFGLLMWYLKTSWGWVVFLSLSIHLAMDQIYFFAYFDRETPWFYFLSYRVSKGFDAGKLHPRV